MLHEHFRLHSEGAGVYLWRKKGVGGSWLAALLDLGPWWCPLAEEADRAYLKTKPLIRISKVI